jgi:acetolactate synthase I/III small subunit
MRHTLAILIENRFGELSRVVGLFSSRGLNIKSLTVAESLHPELSRITMVTEGEDRAIGQILRHLDKQIRVLSVEDVTELKHIEREMMLIKIKARAGLERQEVLSLVNIFRAKIVDISQGGLIIEATGNLEKVTALVELLKPLGISELVRTGTVAMPRLSERIVEEVGGMRA